jgi:hypothetical protein
MSQVVEADRRQSRAGKSEVLIHPW